MKQTELDALLRGLMPSVREAMKSAAAIEIDRALAPLRAMIEQTEKAIGDIELLPGPPGPQGLQGVGGDPGPGVELATIEAMIEAAVADALDKRPVPEDGEDGEPGPAGRDGASVTLEDVQPFIAEEIGRQLAALMEQRASVVDFTKELLAGIEREAGRVQ